jgi:hypothetical protein
MCYMVSARVVRDRKDAFCEERAELQAVLSARSFQRAPKLSRILAYVCEKYFSGQGADLKEYSIAVDALGRAPGFDPQADAIVRVDLHLLRKRLESYYAHDGKDRPVRIVLPLGQYAPEFIPNEGNGKTDSGASLKCSLSPSDIIDDTELSRPAGEAPAVASEGAEKRIFRILQGPALCRVKAWAQRRSAVLAAMVCGLLGLAFGAGGTLALYRHRVPALWMLGNVPIPIKAASAEILQHFSVGGVPDFEDRAIRIRCGSDQDYTDASGLRWSADRFYSGGAIFRRDVIPIFRSADPVLYSTGRQGVFHYDIPVAPGTYEVRLLFAETMPGVEDGMRQTSFIVGARNPDTVDVVADAGGTRTATMKISSNVRPGADRKIHVNFWSADGFLNAMEIVPEINGKPAPIRISTLPHLFVDLMGRHWLSDRYFLGGRNINHAFALNRVDPPLFSRERYGNFTYAIPVAPGYSYRLTLYMAERYWGPQNSGLGGVGSRIFSVRCNGIELLHDFDLLKVAQNSTVVAIRFQHLLPDSTAKLNLHFLPVTNYALLNALEVEAE